MNRETANVKREKAANPAIGPLPQTPPPVGGGAYHITCFSFITFINSINISTITQSVA